jgi:Zn-finger nucleic acid-binding protein
VLKKTCGINKLVDSYTVVNCPICDELRTINIEEVKRRRPYEVLCGHCDSTLLDRDTVDKIIKEI